MSQKDRETGSLTARVKVPEALAPEYLERLVEDLDLAPAQRGRIAAMLESSQPTLRGKWGELMALRLKLEALQSEFDGGMSLMRERIKGELNRSQRKRFEGSRKRKPSKRKPDDPFFEGIGIDMGED